MRELLEYYNNLDVKPFIEAIGNMTQYYIQRGVDIFKNAISGNSVVHNCHNQVTQLSYCHN